MTLIDVVDFPAVRAAIDLTVDASVLPDAVIGLPTFQGAAEAQVLARDPLAADRTGDEQQHIRNAAIYLTAALLLPHVPQLTKEGFGGSGSSSGYGYIRTFEAVPDLVARLRAQAADEIDAVLDPDGLTSERPTGFARACGRRGR